MGASYGRPAVYYDVEEEPEPAVIILAVGIKRRERVYIGGREYRL
jgi:hypothetical protein